MNIKNATELSKGNILTNTNHGFEIEIKEEVLELDKDKDIEINLNKNINHDNLDNDESAVENNTQISKIDQNHNNI